jgi:thiamine kinase-like enzyme
MTNEQNGDLSALFDRVPSLAGSPRSVRRLDGGLTNRNYKVSTPAGTFVARVFSRGGELLAINRDNEYRNTAVAAAAGAAAPVIEYRPEEGILVIGYVAGRTFSNADVSAPGNIARIAGACRRLHAAQPFVNDFNMFDIQRRYLDLVRARGFRLPAGYARLLPRFDAIRQALTARPAAPVPCNNDLLAGNFIDDGDRIWLIDYEYSGNNDPCFELGNIWAECHLSLDGLADLVGAYYGERRHSKIARARLLGLAGKYTWTLWGAIQASTSSLDVDFWPWAMERYEGAAEGFTGPDFARLLDEVQLDD